MRLGYRQRDFLARFVAGRAIVVSDPLTRRLTSRGLLAANEDGDMMTITAAGLRAVADEIDAGRVDPRAWIKNIKKER